MKNKGIFWEVQGGHKKDRGLTGERTFEEAAGRAVSMSMIADVAGTPRYISVWADNKAAARWYEKNFGAEVEDDHDFENAPIDLITVRAK